MSSKTKGKMTWGSSSPDVKVEGKGVVRFMDVTQHNGNSFNSVFTSMGGTGLAYADDFQGKCPICRKSASEHRVLETASSGMLCTEIIAGLRRRFAAGLVTGAERKRWRKGFMVGVMVCKHDPPQSFATMSGDTTPGFAAVARPLVTQVIEGGAVSLDDFANANMSGLPQSRIRSALEEAKQATLREQTSEIPGVRRRYGFLGACAGAKLVAHAAHAPLNMTEMFYRADEEPGDPWGATYSVVSNRTTPTDAWLRSVLDNALSRREDHSFATGGSVASCQTCQATLYLTMCPERTCC
jgi:hypothetical protein